MYTPKLSAYYQFKEGLENIYSYGTAHKYMQVIHDYNNYLIQRGVNKYTGLDKTQECAKQYLQERLDMGYSIYTLKTERSALGKLYGKTIDFNLPERKTTGITRSRNVVENDKHFSVERNEELVTIATATGTRRSDLEKMKVSDFIYHKIGEKSYLFVRIDKSKGGRDRVALVRPDLQKEVEHILHNKVDKNGKIFEKVHSAMDVHSCRREYARELYRQLSNDKEMKEKILSVYPERMENVKSDIYRSKKIGDKFERDSVYLVSQCLGHNRLSVSVNHYLI